ncbi:Fanconi anemia group J protein homolog [Saccostrea echinata]|uniref:Fanconi anemia group J protein homolog n=1 Tax=Saccostrea echinata TaxID=191078 RepID=UPI002A8307B0|nr:Fanconi anemia group J protein homolog [Saccostrea echinata]
MASEKRQMIHGVEVVFPCKPYPSQFSMMEKVIKGIERGENCLLESPTGSGKSLALLCSALAWQTAEYNKREKELLNSSDKDTKTHCTCNNEIKKESENKSTENKARIKNVLSAISASPSGFGDNDEEDFQQPGNFRTPGNLKQNARRHLPISYETSSPVDEPAANVESPEPCTCCAGDGPKARKVPKIYFGTRTHKQIAQIIRELKKTAYREVKMTILAAREHTCIHPAVSQMRGKNEGCKELLDGPGCKFNDRLKRIPATQDFVKKHGLTEAWDIEDFVGLSKTLKVCPYFATRGLRSGADIVFCPYNYLIDPVIRDTMEIQLKGQVVILDEAHNMEDTSREAAGEKIGDDVLEKAINELDELIKFEILTAEHLRVRQLCAGLLGFIRDNQDNLQNMDFDHEYKCWSSYDIIVRLEKIGAGPKQFQEMQKHLSKVFEEALDKETVVKDMSGRVIKLSSATLQTLEHIIKVFSYLYKNDLQFVTDYKMAVVKTTVYTRNINTDDMWLNSKRRRGGVPNHPTTQLSLNFWCMNPAVAFSDLSMCRSVVLTSGTLSPINSFESELGVPFPIKLEANHVIEDKQVWVGAVGQGPRGGTLEAVYRCVETLQFQDELGELVLRVCQQVPHGVLCFVPSYSTLGKLKTRWEITGLWERIKEYKDVMVEPRASDRVDFEDLMRQYYDSIHMSQDQADGRKTGALFVAVFRGKVSEGMDFADNYARAVITVGIPYPNAKDVQVKFKQEFNNIYRLSRGLLSGSEWYDIQAFRALNQALGRCIRHRKDWGAIILVDNRFVKNVHKVQGLSKWVRRKVQTYQAFDAAMDSIDKFTKARQKDMPIVNPDTSFIPGTPVTPGQHLGSQMTSPTTSTPYAFGSETPIGKGFSLEIPLKSIVKSLNTLLGSPEQGAGKADQCVMMSPTDVHKNQSYESLVQNRQVVQPEVSANNNQLALNNQLCLPSAQPLNHMSEIMKVINSSSAPKDKPYYIIIGQGTPQQQMYLIEPPPKLAPQPGNKVVVPTPNLGQCQTPSNVIEQTKKELKGQTPNKGILGHTPGKSLLQTKMGLTSQQPRTATTESVQSNQKTTISSESTRPVIDLTGNSEQPKESSEKEKVIDGKSDKNIETFQNDKSSEKPNRFYKFCSINDPQNPETVRKNPVGKLQEPVTPVLFVENSQDEDSVNNEPTQNNVVSTSRKPLFRKTEKGSSKPSDAVQSYDSEKEFKSSKKSATTKELETSHNNTDSALGEGTSEKEEDCHLRTRRGPRGLKRTSVPKPNLRMSKRRRGVDFLDDKDEGKENQSMNQSQASCKVCGQILLTPLGEFEKRKRVPKFLAHLDLFRNKAVIFTSNKEKKSCFQPCTADNGGISLNSVWCHEEQCCVQFISCTGCHKIGQPDNVIGAQILFVDNSNSSHDLEKGQMWIIAANVSIEDC